MDYFVILFLLAASALFSGISLGFMSLSVHELKRKSATGDRRAAALLTFRSQGNTLLTALVLATVAANSALSVFLGTQHSGVVAVALSTTLIFIFGDVFPQAYFRHYAFALSYYTLPITRLVFWLSYPVARPIAYILDRLLGAEEAAIYSKAELMHIIAEQEDHIGGHVDADEERIMHGALSFSDKVVSDIATPVGKVYALPHDRKLSKETLEEIREQGFSRVPVYGSSMDSVLGILYTADLIGREGLSEATVESLALREPHTVYADEKLDVVLRKFLHSKRHLRIVVDRATNKTVGVVTLEDVLEEVIRNEIEDERDGEGS